MKSFWSRLSDTLTAIRIWTVNLLTLAFLIYIVVVFVAVSQQAPPKIDPEGRVLIIAPEGIVVDQEILSGKVDFPPDFSAEPQIQYRDMVRVIRAAVEDDGLAAVSIDFGKARFQGASTLLGLAEELSKLRGSGKPLIAYSESFSTGSYLLASQADEVYLHPNGTVAVQGLGGYAPYMNEFAGKLKLNIHNFSQGDYKSAADMLTRNDMSEADREQRTALYFPMWDAMKSRMAAGRGVEPEVFQQLADEYPVILGLDTDEANVAAAEALGLIDGTKSFPEYRAYMRERFGTDEEAERETYPHILAGAYLAQLEEKKEEAQEAVSVVFAQGIIRRGKQEPGIAGADDIANLIRRAYEDDDTRALVLRVNSPGGEVLASEMIREELVTARSRDLPVIVSMGDIATSGGMWISAPADKIYATPTTVTGSIGVAVIVPTAEDLFTSIGVNFDGVQTSRYAGWGLGQPMDEGLKAVMERNAAGTYRRFVEVVAEGRQREPEYIDSIGGGRVWLGDKAKEIGLVDEFGNLEDAIEDAAAMAEIEDYRVKYVVPEMPFLARFLRDLMQQTPIRANPDLVELTHRMETLLAPLLGVSDIQPTLMCSGCELELR